MRLCGFHAIELFLAAYLREKGMSAERIRGFRHDTAQMAAEAQQRGLRLKQKVEVRLQKVRENREYLVSRYEPQHPKVLECNALFATLDELNKKVGAAVNAKRAPEGALQVVQ
jgi:flagellar basal body rod protein FlgC